MPPPALDRVNEIVYAFTYLGNKHKLSRKSWPFTATILKRGRTTGDRGRGGWWGGGGDHDYATTRPRPRAWRPDHMHTSTAPDFFVSLFRLKPHAGKMTGHAEPARWERLKKKTRRRVINKE